MTLVDLLHQLGRRFRAGSPAVDDDDVAELAIEGATPGELEGERVIAVYLQQVKARRRRGREVRLLRGPVLTLPGAGLKIREELRPSLFGFVDKNHVAAATQLFRAQRCEGAAHHDKASAPPELLDDLIHALAVNDVSGYADNVRIHVEVDLLDVLIAQRDLVPGGRKPCHRRHREIGKDAALAEGRENLVVGPEGGRVLRCDEVDLHGPVPRKSDPSWTAWAKADVEIR